MITLGNPHRGIEILCHGGAAEQAAHHTLIGRRRRDEGGGEADKTRLVFQSLFRQLRTLDGRQGQEGRPAALGIF